MTGPILVATDLTPQSDPALDMAIGLARDRAAELVIAHAYPLPSTTATDDLFLPGLSQEIDAAACEEAEKALMPVVERARRSGVTARGLVRGGEPDEVVLSEAKRARADLVVIGTHARRGLKRALLGSVASRIIAGSSCPVLTVRSSGAAEAAGVPAE